MDLWQDIKCLTVLLRKNLEKILCWACSKVFQRRSWPPRKPVTPEPALLLLQGQQQNAWSGPPSIYETVAGPWDVCSCQQRKLSQPLSCSASRKSRSSKGLASAWLHLQISFASHPEVWSSIQGKTSESSSQSGSTGPAQQEGTLSWALILVMWATHTWLSYSLAPGRVRTGMRQWVPGAQSWRRHFYGSCKCKVSPWSECLLKYLCTRSVVRLIVAPASSQERLTHTPPPALTIWKQVLAEHHGEISMWNHMVPPPAWFLGQISEEAPGSLKVNRSVPASLIWESSINKCTLYFLIPYPYLVPPVDTITKKKKTILIYCWGFPGAQW